MEVASVLCVRTGARASCIPIPTTRILAADCVRITSSKSPWAIRALTGTKKDRDSCGAILVLKAFESDVRAQVGGLAGPAEPDAQSPSPKRPRLLESDSEAEEPETAEDDSQQSSVASSSKQVSKKASCREAACRRVDRGGFSKIELDGLAFEVGLHKGPGVLVPANAGAVASILKLLDEKYDVLLAAGRDINGQRLAARKDGPHGLLDKVPPFLFRKGAPATDTTSDNDSNKIRYDFRRSAFKLVYFDGGSLKTATKGFTVSRTDAFGNVLCRADYAKMKAGILHKARMAWNKLDQSDAPRFQDRSSSDVTTACSHDCKAQSSNSESMS